MVTRRLLLSVFTRVAGALLGLGAQVVYVRVFGAESFATYVQVVVSASLGLALFGLGADRVVVREIAPVAGSPQAAGATAGLLVFQGLALLAAMTLVALCVLISGQSGLVWALALTAGLMAGQFAGAVCRAHEKHQHVDNIELLARPVLGLAGAWVFQAMAQGPGHWETVAGYVGAQWMAVGLLAVLVRRLMGNAPLHWRSALRPAPLLSAARQRFRYLLLGALSFAMFQLDTWLLSLTLPPQELAAYGIASAIPKLVTFVPVILSVQLMPRIARALAGTGGGAAEAAKLYRRTEKSALLVGLAAFACVLIFGAVGLRLVHKQFDVAYPALCVLSLGHVVNGLGGCLGSYLAMAGREDLMLRSQLVGACCAVLGYATLLPWLGMVGAAMSAAIAMSAAFIWLRATSRAAGAI